MTSIYLININFASFELWLKLRPVTITRTRLKFLLKLMEAVEKVETKIRDFLVFTLLD